MTNADGDGVVSQPATPTRQGTAAPDPTQKSDAQLLRAMQAGDTDAWQELYHRYLPSAWRYTWQRVGDRQIAEDLVAESLLALCRRANELDPDKIKLFGWLRGVIRHKIMDHHGLKARTTAALEKRGNQQLATQSEDETADRPSSSLEQQEQTREVLAVMDGLDETKRVCLEWKYLEDMSVREIAARLDQTEKAIESILYRARLEFRQKYKRLQQGLDRTDPVNSERTETDQKTTSNHFHSVEPSKGSSIQ